jgi:hypothetical protein
VARMTLHVCSLANVRAVELRENVVGQAQEPLARRVLVVLVQPDLGAVLGLVAVDVQVHLRVSDGGDPVEEENTRSVVTRSGSWEIGNPDECHTYQYWPLPFLSGMIWGDFC